jgi:cell division protease FtsH
MRSPRLRLRHPSRRSLLAVGGATLAVVLIVALVPSLLRSEPAGSSSPAFTMSGGWTLLELQRHLEAGDVSEVTATGTAGSGDGQLVAKLTDGTLVPVELSIAPEDAARSLAALGYGDKLTDEAWAAARAAHALAGPATDPVRSLLGSLLPIAMIGAVLLLVWSAFRGGLPMRRPAAFVVVRPGKREAKATGSGDGPAGIRLEDVAGCDEAKAELTEVIDFLRDPDRFARLGATLPRGVLLYGPPGTGKTMLARAVANEAGVAFLHVSGSEFVEKYVGVGARRVRDLFAQARKLGRAVIFVDEFDALAKQRGGPNGHEEREQTLNQLLVELDGFAPNDNIVVIAATNRLDVLDAAVLRPGRFNRKVHVGLPDVRGRREILAVHTRRKPLTPAVDLDALARKTYGFSGAQLADLVNEAAILAARGAGEAIDAPDLQAGWLKVAVGTGRRRSMDERERAIIAAHEVGHAICGRVWGDRRRVEEISLFAHGEALGVTVSSQEDNDLPSESDLHARLVALMGGRAAEELLFYEVTGGASNDFEKATQIATTMVTRFGMGRDPDAADAGLSGRGVLSLLVPRTGGNLPSEVQPAATRAIRAILDKAYADACDTLAEHLATLRRIAAFLVQEERLDGETFAALFDGSIEVPSAEGEWRPAGTRPRDWADVVPFRDRRLRGADAPGATGPVAAPDVAALGHAAEELAEGVPEMDEPVPVSAALPDELSAAVAAHPDMHGSPAPDRAPGTVGDALDAPSLAPASRASVAAQPRRASVASRVRRSAAGWLQVASVRVAPKDRTAR